LSRDQIVLRIPRVRSYCLYYVRLWVEAQACWGKEKTLKIQRSG